MRASGDRARLSQSDLDHRQPPFGLDPAAWNAAGRSLQTELLANLLVDLLRPLGLSTIIGIAISASPVLGRCSPGGLAESRRTLGPSGGPRNREFSPREARATCLVCSPRESVPTTSASRSVSGEAGGPALAQTKGRKDERPRLRAFRS